MKIAILTSGILPVPAVRGGAVENLIDFYLDYNDRHRLHDITVYSVADEATASHPALRSSVNHYRYVTMNSVVAKTKRWLFRHWPRTGQLYYHPTIEYFFREALRDIRRRHFDLILLENRPAYALRLKESVGARVVCHLHNDFLNAATERGREMFAAMHAVATVSDYIAGRVKTLRSDTTAHVPIVTVHNGIDLRAFAEADEAAPALAGDGAVTLLFSGRVTPEKGIAELVEALRLADGMLPEGAPTVQLLVLGSPFYGNTGNENSFVRRLKESAQALGPRIRFTGFVPYRQIPSYLRQADVAVIPSVWDDPFPTTTLEALAAGLPLIATRRGGIPEEVDDECAILLDTGEDFTRRLAEAIAFLATHPDERRAMGEAALRRSRLFDKERYAREFFEFIVHNS